MTTITQTYNPATIAAERDEWRNRFQQLEAACGIWPPGHYYSPILNLSEVQQKRSFLFNSNREVLDIDINEKKQLNLVVEFAKFYEEMPFTAHANGKNRYFFENQMYSYTDGIFLYGMLRHLKPKRYIEIGSGFTSALVLDVNNQFLNNNVELTFIEPYTERLKSLLRPEDAQSVNIIETNLQDVDFSLFSQLESGDILFIDSTHVSKCGSDVNYILFELLPRLKSGVYIHFHDIFWPFEYSEEWIEQGYRWNEVYILRSFLTNNKNYSIELMSNFLGLHHFPFLINHLPLCHHNIGANIWLMKK